MPAGPAGAVGSGHAAGRRSGHLIGAAVSAARPGGRIWTAVGRGPPPRQAALSAGRIAAEPAPSATRPSGATVGNEGLRAGCTAAARRSTRASRTTERLPAARAAVPRR